MLHAKCIIIRTLTAATAFLRGGATYPGERNSETAALINNILATRSRERDRSYRYWWSHSIFGKVQELRVVFKHVHVLDTIVRLGCPVPSLAEVSWNQKCWKAPIYIRNIMRQYTIIQASTDRIRQVTVASPRAGCPVRPHHSCRVCFGDDNDEQ